MWYVDSKGTVYINGLPGQDSNLYYFGDGDDPSGNPVKPNKPKNPLDSLQDTLDRQVDRDLKKSQTQYWEEKAKNERYNRTRFL
jgi:hypothetical protein